MQPYEFGYRVGAVLEKRANPSAPVPETTGQLLGQVAFGTGNTLGQLDPTQRGMVQDLALYSNPITGVPTAINDVSRHLYNGRFMDAGLAGLSGALSFLPGFGFAARGAGRMAVQGGKALARAGAPQVGNAIARGSAKFVNQGRNLVSGANSAASQFIQRGAPLAQNPGRIGKMYNSAIKNPMQAAQFAPLGATLGSAGMAMARMARGAGQPQQGFQPAGPGMYGGGQANTPLASF